MSIEIRTIKERLLEEIFIKKSRFLTYAVPIGGAAEAIAVLDELRGEHADATHICYAFVAKDGSKLSDDGEPSGTAGKPIMNVISKNELNGIVIAVVRYFGGIKLGAGGLTRAYTQCAAAALSKAEIITISPSIRLAITLSYSEYNIVLHLIEGNENVKSLGADFCDEINLTLSLRASYLQAFLSKLKEKLQRDISPTLLDN